MSKRRPKRALWLIAILAMLTATLPSGGGLVRAQEPPDEGDPLVAAGLLAIEGLAAPDVCVEQDATDNDVANGNDAAFLFCNDGVPGSGGGAAGIPVPVKYAEDANGNDWGGLPQPAPQAEVDAATDDLQPESDNQITLDVDLSMPPPGYAPPSKGGYPVLVFMHGCCGGSKSSWESNLLDPDGELWHHSNAWFASRGYIVINYTARGFRNSNDAGSTGTTQLDSRRFEINDYQYLVGLLVDSDAGRRAAGEVPMFNVNPKRIGVVGGSYGGGFSFMALTDPTWKSPKHRIPIKLRAAVPRYGWTDLLESLVPTGHYFDRDPVSGKTSLAPTDPEKAVSRIPLGVSKQSIVAGLYGTGNNVSGNHTTFPNYIHEVSARLNVGEPYDGDAMLESVATSFINDRSAYYQEDFWKRVKGGLKVPTFLVATWTDPLFPTMESVRFYNKLVKLNPKYPVWMYLGDYQHFVQNKPKEWGDLCGDDHHICKIEDFRRANGSLRHGRADNRARAGLHSRVQKFLNRWLKDDDRNLVAKVFSTTTVCPANATEILKADEPGIEYRADSWRALAPKKTTLEWEGGGAAATTTSSQGQDGHSTEADPVLRSQQANKCQTTSQPAGAGVVEYVSEEIAKPMTLMGLPALHLTFTTTATDYWVAARLYDQAPDGSRTMVTRGVCKANTGVNADIDCSVFELFGNAWRFEAGHRVVIEVTQADVPFLRRHNIPSMLSLTAAKLVMPLTKESLRRDFRD